MNEDWQIRAETAEAKLKRIEDLYLQYSEYGRGDPQYMLLDALAKELGK